MKNKQERTQLAESALKLLRDGVNSDNKTKILNAYSLIEDDENFDWKDLDVIYMEWEDLVDEANQILNEL
jgi:hypothetical protein